MTSLLQSEPVLQNRDGPIVADKLDLDLGRLDEGGRGLTAVKVLLIHVSNPRFRSRLRPRFHHLVGVFLRKFLDRRCRAAVGVTLTENRVDGGPEAFGEPLLEGLFGVVLRFFGVVGDVVALGLELLDGALQLGDRGADVGELDDVGVGHLCQLAQPCELVGDLLIVGQVVGEIGDDSTHQRDVAGLDVNARTPGICLYDGEKGVGRQSRRLVDLCPDDLRCCHVPPS